MGSIHTVVKGPVRVDNESPFFCSFVMRCQKKDVVAVLIGNIGRSIHKTLRVGDILKVKGQFKPGGVMYPNNKQIFCVTNLKLCQSVKTGRNLNLWG